jgi:TetR/AcrR family transcriptional repressor of nem operon
MPRPREFEELAVLDAAMLCFWEQGFEGTTVKDLVDKTGLTAASLYNAFGDKRALYQRTLDHYVESSVADRLRRCEAMAPRAAIAAFFEEIIARSLSDADRKGCMLVNAALEIAPHDPAFRKVVADVLIHIEAFFLACVETGQAEGTISRVIPARQLAQHLLAVLLGIRVLARVRPEPCLLEGLVAPALALLDAAPRTVAPA